MKWNGYPEARGLYRPEYEKDACGIGFVADMKGEPSHKTVKEALEMLCRQEHRGGCGSDGETGDGAGIMTEIPDLLLRREFGSVLPAPGQYAVGMLFLPQDQQKRQEVQEKFKETVHSSGLRWIGWRTVPVDPEGCGKGARNFRPFICQALIGCGEKLDDPKSFARKLYVIRKKAEKVIPASLKDHETFYIASLSQKTIVYKGMLTPEQLNRFYLDLADQNYLTSYALVHSRFSTNTFPSWERAHPNRYLVHNGEINTLRGNVNWMYAREKSCQTTKFSKEEMEWIHPVIDVNGSDSAALDSVLEFLTLTGRDIAHAAMMMIPEPWDRDHSIQDPLKAFYEFHSHLMEPWDGPTSIAFCDGDKIGAVLDRNGLRPGRYYVTADHKIYYASEVGVVDVDETQIIEKGRLKPGQLLLVDLKEKRIVSNEELKQRIAERKPYRQWLNDHLVVREALPKVKNVSSLKEKELEKRLRAYGYTYEELNKNLCPMVTEGKDPIGAMGWDTPLAVLSDRPQLLYNYFKQLFAQVTNPAIDAIREKAVTSTVTALGREGNLLSENPEQAKRIRLDTPLIDGRTLEALRQYDDPDFASEILPIVFVAQKETAGLKEALDRLCQDAEKAIAAGRSLLILSDRQMSQHFAAIPALLAVSALHHHLIRQGLRTKASLIVESGEPRDCHHLAMLIGYGADAVYPYVALQAIENMTSEGVITGYTPEEAGQKYLETAIDGVVKILSKMGISTIQSYRGAQIFEAVGISQEVIDAYFPRTASVLGGIGLDVICQETLMRHEKAFQSREYEDFGLEAGSDFQWRHDGEYHAIHPMTVHTLQQAARRGDYQLYKKFSDMAQNEKITFLRDLFSFRMKGRKKVPLEEVESVTSIMRRFKTGAMSYGSLSQEAHETLAIAMNRIGGKSNSGEGGEDPDRYTRDANGDLRRSAIKQVASGRFGVSSHYLTNADEIQIKVAQGAKPGEGGHLPGKKVYPQIAEVRGSTPGVGLISPPPHHDIYSIEDLAQLIHDLKNANPDASINVKLVAKTGVGTIAAGVAKGKADVILISGYEGGTGASPKTSIKHAGLPWEIGLAETHQTLLLNGLRDRVRLEADGKLLTGRDVVIAALLGAEEFGFSTAPLVALGCVMMRVCHLDTCPVGVATQNPELRKKFMGKPEHVENLMTFIAMEIREWMAALGFRTIDEMVGRCDLLEMNEAAKKHWKAKHLDLTPLLYRPQIAKNSALRNTRRQDHGLDQSLDRTTLLHLCKPAILKREPVAKTVKIRNTNRVVGTLVGHEITKRYGEAGLPEDTIRLHFTGSAGQSFGAFIPNGMTLTLEGDANDYVGKGLSGGKLILYPPKSARYRPEENVICGNVAFYGATSGEAYINGVAGERFCVRNSGARVVVEGIGNHGLEYMTGGRVVILGSVGKNFAAGMSGGIAYVLPEAGDREFHRQCNQELVQLQFLDNYEEIDEVKRLIRNHYHLTGSLKAKNVLENWQDTVPKFIKVIPKEYKEMTDKINELIQTGLRGKEAVMTAFKMQKKAREKQSELQKQPSPVPLQK